MNHQRHPLARFDETHGQGNWEQTGFPSRRMTANFAGLAQVLARLGCCCRSVSEGTLSAALEGARLVVIPPPAGVYDAEAECWRPVAHCRFEPEEIGGLKQFVERGGSLLAFGYRFGDAFTGTNLSALLAAFGCELNTDAVVDFCRLKAHQPLATEFETLDGSLLLPWPVSRVRSLRWRCMATLGIRPGTRARPLVISPSVRCLSYDCQRRQTSFQILPLAVVGTLGAGRFAFFGGPHVFETGPLGLLHAADNLRFLHQLAAWLLAGRGEELFPPITNREWLWRGFQPAGHPNSAWPTIEAVEAMLRESELLHALPVEKWSV